MFLLPTFNAVLQPCAVGPAAFRAHPQGHFCDSCQRVVQDFSQSTNPVADLAAARTAAPDGRVCGSFRTAQVQQNPPSLTRRLRCFLVALVLVVGQGLTAREALAQAPQVPSALKVTAVSDTTVYTYVEQMPQPPGGGGNAAIAAAIIKGLRFPPIAISEQFAGSRLVVEFTITPTGTVSNIHIIKNLDSRLDNEVLRVVRTLPRFTPGRQQGKPVNVKVTIPITICLRQ